MDKANIEPNQSITVDALLQPIRIVLVNTSHPGNIGAAARAMKTMGLTQLYLVQPSRFPDQQAVSRAAGAADVVEHAVVVDTLAEAIADCAIVVGASARDRRLPWPSLNARDCAQKVSPLLPDKQVAFVFGKEDSGLSNDQLQRCHWHLHIPTGASYASLNLAMAVQIISYELHMAARTRVAGTATKRVDTMANWDRALATSTDLERYFAHLEETLLTIGFLKPQAPKQLMPRLRRLYMRCHLDEMEVQLLRGILTAVQSLNGR